MLFTFTRDFKIFEKTKSSDISMNAVIQLVGGFTLEYISLALDQILLTCSDPGSFERASRLPVP